MQALRHLKYGHKVEKVLMKPQREVTVNLSMRMDNGNLETFEGYRVQHNNARGPYKGGLRYHPAVDLDDIRRCAFPGLLSHRSAAMAVCPHTAV